MVFLRWLLLLLLFPSFAQAQMPVQLHQDFAPSEGIILMPMADSFLVDLDATRQLKAGDILSVLEVGETIVHPETKVVLGRVEHVIGFLEVTRVMSGYSYVVPITEGLALSQGDRVRRFDQVPARLDESIPAPLALELKRGLSHLKWVDEAPAENSPWLQFSLVDDRLQVTSGSETVVAVYPFGAAASFAPVATARPRPEPATTPESERSMLNRGVDTVLGSVGIGRGDTRLEAPGIARRQDADGVWMSPPLNENPIGVAAGDLTGDGRTEIAIALDRELRIMRLDEGQLTSLAVIDFPAGTRLLTLDALDLNHDNRPELIITAAIDTDLRSQVVEFRDDEFQRVITMVNWFLRVVELPGEGPVLLAQRMSTDDNPFRPPVFRVERHGDRLVRGADLALPERINLFSMLPLTETGSEAVYASLNADDRLQLVTSGNDRLWLSTDYFGGSDTGFYHRQDTTATIRVPVNLQKRLLRLPSGQILTIQNQGSRLLQGLKTFTDGQVVAFEWDNLTRNLRETWRTPLQKGYVADVAVADVDGNGRLDLMTLVRFQEKNILQRGHSALLIYQLHQ